MGRQRGADAFVFVGGVLEIDGFAGSRLASGSGYWPRSQTVPYDSRRHHALRLGGIEHILGERLFKEDPYPGVPWQSA